MVGSIMVYAASLICIAAVLFNMWIAFRVVDEWLGLLAAIAAILLFPLSQPFLAILMFFIPSTEAGPLSLWLGFIVIAIFYRFSIFGMRG